MLRLIDLHFKIYFDIQLILFYEMILVWKTNFDFLCNRIIFSTEGTWNLYENLIKKTCCLNFKIYIFLPGNQNLYKLVKHVENITGSSSWKLISKMKGFHFSEMFLSEKICYYLGFLSDSHTFVYESLKPAGLKDPFPFWNVLN